MGCSAVDNGAARVTWNRLAALSRFGVVETSIEPSLPTARRSPWYVETTSATFVDRSMTNILLSPRCRRETAACTMEAGVPIAGSRPTGNRSLQH
jgi:hypothetical protein